jgi:hypothetical protein
MRRTLFPLLLVVSLTPGAALADSVVASDRVKSQLNVRKAAGGPVIASLLPGERAAHIATRGDWREIELPDGRVGFVSTSWSRVVPDTEPAPPGAAHLAVEEGGLVASVRGFLRAAATRLGAKPRVDLVLQEPARDGAVHEHDDPLLPVAGIATPEGSSGTYDIVIALDGSTSTHAFSEADVNGDGRLDPRWKGPDSIYRAQLRAARELVAEIGRLPYNRGGQRIRVGVVTFAGDEDMRGPPFEKSPGALLQLGQLDAAEHVPLTADYARLDRELERLASREPAGSTDFAAGIGRSLAALGVLTTEPAPADPRRAQKAILFLTDGKPMLPGDRKTAERAALYASRLAGEAGVHIHTFALGHDVVRRGVNPVLPRMAERSGGSFTQLAAPGEIVALLRSTSFSFVSSVRVANATRGDEIAEIVTAIDGSFYAELPLAEGPNEIEVEAVMNDGRRTSQRLAITWVDTKPRKALQAKLAVLREENAALVEQLRKKLARQIETKKGRAARDLEISVSVPAAPRR